MEEDEEHFFGLGRFEELGASEDAAPRWQPLGTTADDDEIEDGDDDEEAARTAGGANAKSADVERSRSGAKGEEEDASTTAEDEEEVGGTPADAALVSRQLENGSRAAVWPHPQTNSCAVLAGLTWCLFFFALT
jgi:hypothetical protein